MQSHFSLHFPFSHTITAAQRQKPLKFKPLIESCSHIAKQYHRQGL
jgi:hypothetical protein